MTVAMRFGFTGFLLCLLLCGTATHPAQATENVSREWLDLWSRCRIAVETGRPVDAAGLDDLGLSKQTQAPLTVGKDITIRPGYDYMQQSWGRRGSSFVIRETEQPAAGGTVTRQCETKFAAEDHVVTDDEILFIAKAFMDERKRLIGLGGYEIRDPDHIWQIDVGVGPIGDNQNGCRVISALMIRFDPENSKAPRYFSSLSGEQTVRPGCHGPALLKPRG